MKSYIPKAGDIITLDFDPQSGHEQKGRRPAIVISNEVFNRGTKLAIVCPITSKDKNFPFHIPLEATTKASGFVMVEQIKSIDYKARGAKFVEEASDELMEDIRAVMEACM